MTTDSFIQRITNKLNQANIDLQYEKQKSRTKSLLITLSFLIGIAIGLTL